MKTELPVVATPTRVEAGLRCYRRHVLGDVLEKGRSKSPAAAFGTVMHAGVGELWLQRDWRQAKEGHAVKAAMDVLRQEWDKAGVSSPSYSLGLAERMFDAYVGDAQRVGPYTNVGRWQPLTIEDRVEIAVGGYRLSFQLDRAYHDMDGDRIVIVDLKTVSRPDLNWRASWYRSLQMKLYRYAARKFYDTDNLDIVIEGLDKSSKPKVHYVMLPQWSEAMLAEAVERFIEIAEKDEELIRTAGGGFDQDGEFEARLQELALTTTSHSRADCMAYNSPCPFLPLCDAEPEHRLGLLHAEYKDIPQDY